MPPWFQLSGQYYLDEFCERALGGDSHGYAQITRLELLKDTRLAHWFHEFLVFSLVYEGAEFLLYFEHGWGGDSMIPFAWGSEKNAGDELTFYGLNDEEERERRSFTTSVLIIQLITIPAPSSFTLRSLARLLSQYSRDHPMYALFSANCWAWSRAIVLSVLAQNLNGVESVTMAGKHEITPTQLQAYIMIEYGAYGGLLLRSIQSGNKKVSGIHYLAVRALLQLYSILDLLIWFKRMFFGPLSWTIRLITLSITPHETVDDKGTVVTHMVLGPDLTDLVPTVPGSSLSSLQPFCQPARYLYLLSVPVVTANVRIVGAHIFLFGSVVDSNGASDAVDPSDWFECGILRRVGSRNVEVPQPGCQSLAIQFRPRLEKNMNCRPYAAVHDFEFESPLISALQEGDVIALWAKGHSGAVHKPAQAMIKITSRPAQIIRPLDVISGLDMLVVSWRYFVALNRTLYSTPLSAWFSNVLSCGSSLMLRLFVYTPLWLNHWCDAWLWGNISAMTKLFIGSVTPLGLPESCEKFASYSLPVFLINLFPDGAGSESPPIASATLRAIEFGVPQGGGHERLFLHVLYKELDYVFHISRPSSRRSRMCEYVSFIFKPHGFAQDVVTIYRCGDPECTARADARIFLRLMFHGPDASADGDSAKPVVDLRSFGQDLLQIQDSYWWYFWLNADTWTWPWSVVKMTMQRSRDAIKAVEVAGQAEVVPLQEAASVLAQRYEGWRQADRKIYGKAVSPALVSDWYFFARRTRAALLLAFVVSSSYVIHLVTSNDS